MWKKGKRKNKKVPLSDERGTRERLVLSFGSEVLAGGNGAVVGHESRPEEAALLVEIVYHHRAVPANGGGGEELVLHDCLITDRHDDGLVIDDTATMGRQDGVFLIAEEFAEISACGSKFILG